MIIIVTGVERCVWSSRWHPVAIVCIAQSKHVMDVIADSWYIIRIPYRVWRHSERHRQQQTKFVKLLPELLQPVFGIMDWMTLMLYQMQMSSAIYRWFSGSCHIKGHNTFRISGTTNAITKPHIPEDPNPQTHLCVNLKFHKYFILYLHDTTNHRTVVWIHLI